MRALKEMILREIAGESLLIPTGQIALRIHGMIVLTESGAFLWKKLETEQTLESLVEAMLEEYDVDTDTARKDVEEFVGKMKKLGILEGE